MARKKVSETVTENIFRDFYGANTFIEKAAILIFSVIVGIIALWLKQKQQTMRQHKTKCNIT